MFDRYTEGARLLIYSARAEASQTGSSFIDTEHLLLALLKDENSLVRRLLPASAVELVEAQARNTVQREESVPLSTDLPLTDSMKRVLWHGSKAADALNSTQISVDHLSVGLLRETDCGATRILTKYGVDYERGMRELGGPAPPFRDQPPRIHPTRETLTGLVASLPDGAIQSAYAALVHLQEWPRPQPRMPPHMTNIMERFERRFRAGRGRAMIGGAGG
jgi:ATP-dependent Clp protease ATP-binding subunit ClpC